MDNSTARRPRPAPTWEQQTMRRASASLAAGAIYFVAMVAAGWVFGPIREYCVGAGLDPLLAVLLEAPLMILVMLLSSALTIRALRVRDRAGDRLVMGSFAVLLVLISEFAGGALVRGWGFYETLANFTTKPGSVLVALLTVALVTPLLQRRTRSPRVWGPGAD